MSPGRYRHYKGKDYIVLGIARHSETEEELVVYRQDYGEPRTLGTAGSMFEEMVTIDGQQVPRFARVDEWPQQPSTPFVEPEVSPETD